MTRIGDGLRAAGLFFAYGFVLHGMGVLLHEFVGHGGGTLLSGCGIGGWEIRLFGGCALVPDPCPQWTATRVEATYWSGILLQLAAGYVALTISLRRHFPPLARLMLLLTASISTLNAL